MSNPALAARLRAQAAIDVRRFADAIREARVAVSLAPEDPNAYALLSLAHLLSGDDAASLAAAEDGLSHGPNQEWLHRLRGIALRMLGRFVESIEAAEEALKLAPGFSHGYLVRAAALRAMGKLNDAAADLTRALELAPDDAEVHGEVADLASEQERWELAEEHYRASLRRDPLNARALNGLGAVLDRQNRGEEARLAYKSAILIDPTLDAPKLNLKRSVDAHVSPAQVLGGLGLAILMAVRVVACSGRSEAGANPAFWGSLVAICVGMVWIMVWRDQVAKRMEARALEELTSQDPQLVAIYRQVSQDIETGRLAPPHR